MRLKQFKFITLTTGLACVALLAACDSSSIDEGGGSGDTDDNAIAAALIAPFSGIYDLQDEWNGTMGDDAYLSIDIPGSTGTASASLYDFDDASNCLPSRATSEGTVRVDDFTSGIFLDDILQFSEASLSLSGNLLTIEFNDDGDLNNDGSTQDRVSITADKIGVSQITDVGSSC